MDWRAFLVLAHVLAAFWWVAGYVGTNICTEIARRSRTNDDCRAALLVSTRIDIVANRIGGTAAGLTGILALIVFGYGLTTPWVLASIILFGAVILAGIFFWGRFGAGVDQAAARDDWPAVRAGLNEPRIVAASRIENVAVVAIIALMVLRPG